MQAGFTESHDTLVHRLVDKQSFDHVNQEFAQ